MSVWKKTAKAHQKTHRERHQPEERKHLGLLEKKKDYIKRAQDYNEKKQTLKLLKKRALNKNPDEFYYHMLNSKVEDGMHFDKETQPADTPDQIQLMRTQDLKYIVTKKTQEKRKIEKLQSELHLISVENKKKNKHVYFDKELAKKALENNENMEKLADMNLPDIDESVVEAGARKRQSMYNELAKRIKRERELTIVQRKIEVTKALESKSVLKPKRVKKGTKDRAPVYVWKYERKK